MGRAPRPQAPQTPQDPRIGELRDKATVIMLEAILAELETRQEAGTLAADLKNDRTTQLLWKLNELIKSTSKSGGVNLTLNLPAQLPAQQLNDASIMRETPLARARLAARNARLLEGKKKGPAAEQPAKDAEVLPPAPETGA